MAKFGMNHFLELWKDDAEMAVDRLDEGGVCNPILPCQLASSRYPCTLSFVSWNPFRDERGSSHLLTGNLRHITTSDEGLRSVCMRLMSIAELDFM